MSETSDRERVLGALRVLTRAVDIYGNVDDSDRDLSATVWCTEVAPALYAAMAVCDEADAHDRVPVQADVSATVRLTSLEVLQNKPEQLERLIDDRLEVAKRTMKACLTKHVGVKWPED